MNFNNLHTLRAGGVNYWRGKDRGARGECKFYVYSGSLQDIRGFFAGAQNDDSENFTND
jgi:hypothetical protein